MTKKDAPLAAPEKRLTHAEMELGRALPHELRQRLKKRNGGAIFTDDRYELEESEWQLLPVWDPSDRRTARRTASHLVHANRNSDLGPGNETALVIAENGTDDLLLIEGDFTFWWDHETRKKHPVGVRWS